MNLEDKLEGIILHKKCKTRLDDSIPKDQGTVTELSVDLSRLTLQQVLDRYATKSLVIECQKIWRTQGEIPSEFTYIPEPTRPRQARMPDVDKLDEEQALVLLRKLQERLRK